MYSEFVEQMVDIYTNLFSPLFHVTYPTIIMTLGLHDWYVELMISFVLINITISLSYWYHVFCQSILWGSVFGRKKEAQCPKAVHP